MEIEPDTESATSDVGQSVTGTVTETVASNDVEPVKEIIVVLELKNILNIQLFFLTAPNPQQGPINLIRNRKSS